MTLVGADVLIQASNQRRDAAKALAAWRKVAESAQWQSLADVRGTYPQADGVKVASGSIVTVFNIRGNTYRLLTRTSYRAKMIKVVDLLTHAEYEGQMEGSAMKTFTKTSSTVAAADYMALVERFPLRPIRSAADHKAALRIIDELMKLGDDQLTAGQADYLAALGRFVIDYERERLATKFGEATPLEVLQHLMESRGMTQAELAHLIGSRSAATMILHGDRELSKSQIRALAKHFSVSPAVFL